MSRKDVYDNLDRTSIKYVNWYSCKSLDRKHFRKHGMPEHIASNRHFLSFEIVNEFGKKYLLIRIRKNRDIFSVMRSFYINDKRVGHIMFEN